MDALVLFVFGTLGLVGGGILVAKLMDQHARDKHHVGYKLSFPADKTVEEYCTYLTALSGTLRAKYPGITGTPTIAFEMWAKNGVIKHVMRVPWEYADYVVGQLRTLVPGIRVDPDLEPSHAVWVHSIELGIRNSHRELRINPKAISSSILAATQGLRDDEVLMMQWVVAPAPVRERPSKARKQGQQTSIFQSGGNPDAIEEQRSKLSEANMHAVLRIAAVGPTQVRAKHIMQNIRNAISQTRGPTTKFVNRYWYTKRDLQARFDRATAPVSWPATLSVTELSALVAWPINNPHVPGLSMSVSRHLPPTAAIAREGIVIGTANMPGAERPIAVSHKNAVRHMHVLGPPGTGKSVLDFWICYQHAEAGNGLILIDPKGEEAQSLTSYLLDRMPASRKDDVIYLNLKDKWWPVAFNIFDQGADPSLAIDNMINLIVDNDVAGARSLTAPKTLYNALHTLVQTPGLTFVDIGKLLTPNGEKDKLWRDQVIRNVKNPQIQDFWQGYESKGPTGQDRAAEPVFNRIWEFTTRPEIRNIMGQSKSSFQMRDVIKDNKILIINTSGVSKQTARLAVSLIVNAAWDAAMSITPEKPNFMVLDEFQDFVRLPLPAGEMLAKARGSKLGMVLSHQHIQQLPMELRGDVLSDTATKIAFQLQSDDARLMARAFGKSVDETDFLHLGAHEALVRVATDEGISPPVSIQTKDLPKPTGYANYIIQRSRQTYGTPVEDVLKEMDDRYKVDGQSSAKRLPPSPDEMNKWG